ncbi:MAG TPA: 5-formyltetrahydrofolate cyclo-ligase, partial [Moraxellaceae bacterium]
MPSPTDTTERARLRRELRARRRQLSPRQQRSAARHLALALSRLPLLRCARRIALYWPVDGEIDARPLRRQRGLRQRQFYLPVLQAFPPDTLRFRHWTGHRMARNRFGIPEPRRGRALPARAMDAILLPLTGFDRRGNRLGMGGGFYDRTLAFHRHGLPRPRLVGVAHHCQEVPALPAAPWDIPLHMIVTDRACY